MIISDVNQVQQIIKANYYYLSYFCGNLLRLREHAYNTVDKGQRLHIQGKILYGEVSVQLKHFA